jgi:hypothetical protein
MMSAVVVVVVVVVVVSSLSLLWMLCTPFVVSYSVLFLISTTLS